MAKSILAYASLVAAVAKAQTGVYTESVITGTGTASAALATYTVTTDTSSNTPLYLKNFTYPYLPYQADTSDGPRGAMQGYNLCNSTTAGDDAMCATAFLNSVDDFCIWGAPGTGNDALEVVADVEGEMVAYCTTPRYGARTLPQGAITGLQFIQTPDYVELVGYIDQTAIRLQANDTGGEEDPHGADMRGNPLGSLFYSSAFGPGPASEFKQSHEWHYFVGGGIFCLKVCDPASPNGAELCQHIYDRIGCAYNVPADYAAINGTFTSCKGDDQLPPGVYVENGQTMTYSQPPESLGPISSIPYTAVVPSSSQCSTYSSAQLFTELKSASSSASSSAASSSAAASSAASGAKQAAAAASSGTTTSNTSSATQGVLASAVVIFAGLVGLLTMA